MTTNALTTTPTPIVHGKDGEGFANSRDVADLFGKEHHNVLKDIRRLMAQADMAYDLTASWFRPIDLPDSYGRLSNTYDMTRDGFTLLVMGYTGPKAMKFKVAYIQAFNEMEAKLKGPQLPDFTNPAAAARAWAGEYEQRQLAQQKVIELETKVAEDAPKVGFYDHVVGANADWDFGTAAKMLGWGPTLLRRHLLKTILYRENHNGTYLPYSQFVQKGYFRISLKTNGQHVHRQMRVTPTGLEFLRQRLAK